MDLAAALDAVMAEAWDDDLKGTNEHPLLGAFQKAFWKDPLGAWKLIQSGRYDPGAQIILREWINSVAYSDPVLVVSMLGEMPRGLLREAVSSALVGAGQKPGSLDQIVEKLTSLPPSQENFQWLMMACNAMPTGGDSNALREKWTAMSSGREKIAAQFAWAASLREADRATMEAQWSALPENARQQALNSLFAQLYPDSPALIPALDLAMEKGEWGVVATLGAGKLDEYEMDPKEKAEWAMKLPERSETQRIFDGAVAGLLRDDPEAAKEWISGMDSDDWRKKRALLQFSRLALDSHHSMENFRWAYGQITDPATKKSAEGMLQVRGRELEWTDPDE
ncbi:hypothetical protein [Haloferula sp. BvORR071]|uniref:hypothetical protein n=1 Tax=Haloferula sp. BvORR071 TaxID=1396141 RepID=UPI002240F623|nr:hypothetical protein [Haloferula sp. BvORR071]